MRVFHPRLWDRVPKTSFSSDTFELALIVPRSGERRRVYLDQYEPIEDGQQITCIWAPPYSELNGWDEQPSEIALSYVITGTAHLRAGATQGECIESADNFADLKRLSLVVDIDVHMVNPLIDTLLASTPDVEFTLCSYGIYISTTAQSISLWLGSGHASFSRMREYIYLTSYTGESTVEALVRIINDEMILAYHRYSPPIGGDAFILNNVLNKEERALFEKVIAIAEPLVDTCTPYLLN